jgi:hypothetical protein
LIGKAPSFLQMQGRGRWVLPSHSRRRLRQVAPAENRRAPTGEACPLRFGMADEGNVPALAPTTLSQAAGAILARRVGDPAGQGGLAK